jgi:hypothetical protein
MPGTDDQEKFHTFQGRSRPNAASAVATPIRCFNAEDFLDALIHHRLNPMGVETD